jgi:hypothetical protein
MKKRIRKGTTTTMLSIIEILPTGTIPKIFKPAPIQIIARQIGILYCAISGKRNEAYSTKSTG